MSETKIKDLRINKGLTKQQLIESTTITENELSFVTDNSVVDVPTPTEAGKVLTSTEDGVEWAEGGSGGLPDQTGNAGKFLTTDGTDASWSDKPLVNEATTDTSVIVIPQQGIDVAYKNARNNVVIGNGYHSSGSSWQQNVIVGSSSDFYSNNGVAVGFSSGVYEDSAIAIGFSTRASGAHSIQLGSSGDVTVNSDANTFKVANANGNFELMSADGTIPAERLANTIGNINALLDALNGESV